MCVYVYMCIYVWEYYVYYGIIRLYASFDINISNIIVYMSQRMYTIIYYFINDL